MTTPNVELLREACQEAEWHWNPAVIAARRMESGGSWYTSFGIEGHVVNAAHPEAIWHWVPDPQWESEQFAVLVSVGGSRKEAGRNASFVARKLLGLDREQAARLFGADTIEKMRKVVGELIGLPEVADDACA